MAALALASAVLGGCAPAGEPAGRVPPPPEAIGHEEFEDPVDLLHAVEEGTFAERAGLDPTPPPSAAPELVVRFESGTEVPQEAMPELRELVQRLEAEPHWELSLVGCSDPSGPADLNVRISADRAGSVADALRELGVSDARLVRVVGRGEGCDVQERVVHVEASAPERAAGGGRSGAT